MDTTRRITRRRHRTRVALVSWHTSPLAAPGAEHAGGMNVYVRELALAPTRLGPWVDVITSAADMARPRVRVLAPRLRLVTVPIRWTSTGGFRG
jgi:D-inositol-3-phosphate glycosyltransferase